MTTTSTTTSTTSSTPSARDSYPGGRFLLGGELPVGRLGYGSMQLSGPGVWGPPADRAHAVAVLRAAVELGVTLVDTADSYGPDDVEQLVAEALHPYDGIAVATKGGYLRTGPNEWHPHIYPKYLRQQVEKSLRNLRTERIDLYQLHTPAEQVPIEDAIDELADLRAEGKIRFIGVSNVSLAQLERARSVTEIVSVQNHYNAADRSSEDVLRYAEANGIAFLPYHPLDTGALAAPGGALARAAARHDVLPSQFALSWLLDHSPVMLPIPGTASLEHLAQNMASARITLTDADRDVDA